MRPNAPVIECLAELRGRGLRMALLTNNVREWEPLWRAKLPELDEIFELVVDSAFVGMRKPERADLRADARASRRRAACRGMRLPRRPRRQLRGRAGARDDGDPLRARRPGAARAAAQPSGTIGLRTDPARSLEQDVEVPATERARVDATLTIGQLAERAGTQPGTLRMWETRYGFPRAQRLASGHRRYLESELEHVRDVLTPARDRPLAAGGDRARAGRARAAGLDLRRAATTGCPSSTPIRVPKRAAAADEPRDRGRGERARRAAACSPAASSASASTAAPSARWRTLCGDRRRSASCSRTSTGARAAADGPPEVPLDRRHPLAREWAVVWDAPEFAACLAARERTRPELPDRERVFDTLWSVERVVVREAAQAAVELAARRPPSWSWRCRRASAIRPSPIRTGRGGRPRSRTGCSRTWPRTDARTLRRRST